MGCGCGKASASTPVMYMHIAKDGKRTTNLSETQARAMQIRSGGSYSKQ